MAKLAIRGHATRGREVIELLEMLGGKNVDNYKGNNPSWYYIIRDNDIDWCHECTPDSDFVSYTLEEFLEKFPYKVGDKVMVIRSKNTYIISQMIWNGNEVVYALSFSGNNTCWFSVNELQPYKEETMEEKGTLVEIDLTRELCVADVVEVILGDYEFVLKDGKTYFVKKKPQYPKTYEKCCDVLDRTLPIIDDVEGYKWNLIMDFQELLVCRDAYWKIAGEQMGLGKPWEPNWLNTEQDKFVLYTHDNVICLNRFVLGHNVLAFPTAEMRDAFLENFKDLIEQCKELL